ncbi:DUF5658 family protein [Chloroflexota bacterium]
MFIARQHETTGHFLLQKLYEYKWRGLGWKVAYLVLQQCDLLLTVLVTQHGLHELNPVMRDLLSMPVPLVIAKFIVPLLVAWLVPGKLLIPAIMLLGAVVAWNLKELFLFLV